MITLLSGVTSSAVSTLEPVTGVRNLTVESKSNYNDSLRVYEDNNEELKDRVSVIIDIPEEMENTSTILKCVSGIEDINDIYGLLHSINDLKINIHEKDRQAKKLESRNETKKEIIYNPDNLREKSNLTREQIYNMLEGSNLQVLADSYYEMENKHNINAIFLMALNIEESGHGTSILAQENNNIGGVKSVTGGWATFDDWKHSLEYIANLIDEMYLTETGTYYNGTSIYDVNIRYCEGNQWAYNLNTIAKELLERAKADQNQFI